MAEKDTARVVLRDTPGPNILYQSDAAKQAAKKALPDTLDDEEVKPAAVTVPPKQAVPVQKEDPDRPVKVRFLVSRKRIWIAKTAYSFKAGKEAIVPLHVRTLLAEKGLIA